MMHLQHVFGRVRFLQLLFGKAVLHSQQLVTTAGQ